MIDFNVFNRSDYYNEEKLEELVVFLHSHLGRYGDPLEQIKACIDYAFSSAEGKGGFVATASDQGHILGAAVVNHTGMGGYIPSQQLVYIAVQEKMRGQGLGKKLLQFTLDSCPGDMALHVEYDNPAVHLYKSLGFVNKYAEMRRPGEKNHG